MEANRESAEENLLERICSLEAITMIEMSPVRLQQILRTVNQIISLSGMYGLTPLEHAAKSLSNLAQTMRTNHDIPPDAIAVHIRAMRLLLIGARDTETTGKVLRELQLVLLHFDVSC